MSHFNFRKHINLNGAWARKQNFLNWELKITLVRGRGSAPLTPCIWNTWQILIGEDTDLGHSLSLAGARCISFKNTSLNSYWLLCECYPVCLIPFGSSHWTVSQLSPKPSLLSLIASLCSFLEKCLGSTQAWQGLPNSRTPYNMFSSILWLSLTSPPKMPLIVPSLCLQTVHLLKSTQRKRQCKKSTPLFEVL